MGRHTVFALALIAVACDGPSEVQVGEQERLGRVATVELRPVVDREIRPRDHHRGRWLS